MKDLFLTHLRCFSHHRWGDVTAPLRARVRAHGTTVPSSESMCVAARRGWRMGITDLDRGQPCVCVSIHARLRGKEG